jgi:hypothetical protein
MGFDMALAVGAVVLTHPLEGIRYAFAAGEPCDGGEGIVIGEAVDLSLIGDEAEEELADNAEHAAAGVGVGVEGNTARREADTRSEVDVAVGRVACDLLFEQTLSGLVHVGRIHRIGCSSSESGPVGGYHRKYVQKQHLAVDSRQPGHDRD